jgi:phosphomannomutase
MDLSKIFKAYDIRGVYSDEIDEKKVRRIAMAYAAFLQQSRQQSAISNQLSAVSPSTPLGVNGVNNQPLVVAVGRDVRLSGAKLQTAVIDGLTEAETWIPPSKW